MGCENSIDKEIASLLQVVDEKFGYDFRKYSQAHIRRRIMNRVNLGNFPSVSALKEGVLTDEHTAFQFLQDLSITVTEMFRDPGFYRSLRETVVPILKTYPFIKIWHAGCSTGQEVYSMAILLKEEGLYDRTTIYATDFNQEALNKGRAGIYPGKLMKDYTANYQASGGREAFSDYYTSSYEMAIMDNDLKKHIVWANHNLVTDSVFAEVHMVLCRNVMIYFEKELQKHVHDLLYHSLIKGGVLCLGTKESLQFGSGSDTYQALDKRQKIYKKKY